MPKIKLDPPALMKAVGRTLIALLFILAGFDKLMNLEATYGVLMHKKLTNVTVATYLTIIFPLIEMVLGCMLLVGYRLRIAATLLCLMVFSATIVVHDFWNMTRIVQMLHVQFFLKNIALMGALLYLMGDEPDGYSLDFAYRQLPKKKSTAR